MKKTLKGLLMGLIVGGSGIMVFAYNTQLWSPIQFVKQLFVTSDGSADTAKAVIKIDGTNGTIDAQNLKIKGNDVATKSYAASVAQSIANAVLNSAKSYAASVAQSKANAVLNSAKIYADSIKQDITNSLNGLSLTNEKIAQRLNKTFATVCNAETVGKTLLGDEKHCKLRTVTNHVKCYSNGRDNVEWYEIGHTYKCANGYLRQKEVVMNPDRTTSLKRIVISKIGWKTIYYWG